jgi:RNA polymerase primary sigma factor
MNDILSDYLRSLYGIEPLTTEEEHRLSDLIQQGDESALDKLVTHNLRFVVSVVCKTSYWNHSRLSKEDILAIGNECLLQAGRLWVPTKGNRFTAYAKNFIVRGVQREADNTADMIRLPINIKEQIKKMNYTERSLTQVLGRKPKTSEVASVANMSVQKVNRLKGFISREPVSLDALQQDKFLEELED